LVLGALSPGVKRPGREADLSPQSSAEVENGGATPSLPHMSSWYGTQLVEHRGNFTFYLNFLFIILVSGIFVKAVVIYDNDGPLNNIGFTPVTMKKYWL
jgi:hypothetical protein